MNSAGFKQKLDRGEPVLVINLDHPSPSLAEFLGRLPIDALLIDCEQGSADIETLENLARAARLGGLPSIVRLFSWEDWVIERYLGRGVDGLVAPRLETAAQAAAVVEAVRYCYPRHWESKIVVVQIETRRAVEGLDELLRLDGIDAYFIGPVDLAKSLGHKGDFGHPQVQEAMDAAIAAIHGAGKVSGILVDRENIRGYLERGVQFLYGHVNDLAAHGALELARLVKRH